MANNTTTYDFGNGTVADATEVNTNFDDVVFGASPIGAIISWLKNFYELDTGTNTSVTADKLVDSGATFETDGVAVDMIVLNTTDSTEAYVTAVDSETELTLSADIFTGTSKDYDVLATPRLQANWKECDGTAISDSDSPFNGQNLPDLNGGSVEENYSFFLRGHSASGLTETSQNKAHTHELDKASGSTGSAAAEQASPISGTRTTQSSGGAEARPMAYTVVWIMRIK